MLPNFYVQTTNAHVGACKADWKYMDGEYTGIFRKIDNEEKVAVFHELLAAAGIDNQKKLGKVLGLSWNNHNVSTYYNHPGRMLEEHVIKLLWYMARHETPEVISLWDELDKLCGEPPFSDKLEAVAESVNRGTDVRRIVRAAANLSGEALHSLAVVAEHMSKTSGDPNKVRDNISAIEVELEHLRNSLSDSSE